MPREKEEGRPGSFLRALRKNTSIGLSKERKIKKTVGFLKGIYDYWTFYFFQGAEANGRIWLVVLVFSLLAAPLSGTLRKMHVTNKPAVERHRSLLVSSLRVQPPRRL